MGPAGSGTGGLLALSQEATGEGRLGLHGQKAPAASLGSDQGREQGRPWAAAVGERARTGSGGRGQAAKAGGLQAGEQHRVRRHPEAGAAGVKRRALDAGRSYRES